MVSVVACLVVGLVLLASAVLKLVDPAGTRAALATYGVRREDLARALWGALVAVEAALAVTVGAGIDAAAFAAAGLLAVFCAAQAVALATGRGGAPCACFGARGRVSRGSLARTALLAAALAILPLLPRSEPSTEGWLAIGLAVALAGLVALAVVVLALAREVGVLRLAADPRGALEVAHEGPEVGARTVLAEQFELTPGRIGLAVFSSEGCTLCRALEPAVEAFGRDPRVVLRRFDEVRGADAWAVADVPGSPFAVALDADGTVLAKGTFNTGAQLESVLAAAERRRREPSVPSLSDRVAAGTSRRGFLSRVSGAVLGLTGAGTVGGLVAPGDAEAYHFCGHIYTTDSCPHPTGIPRIDSRGMPLRAADGHPVDDLGRLIGSDGRAVDEDGRPLTDADGRPLPIATRTAVCDVVEDQFGWKTKVDGAWYRCCGGQIRKLVDCCSLNPRRINGDASLTGYCYKGRKVFCVMYYQTRIKC